jgi:hypothetical protein
MMASITSVSIYFFSSLFGFKNCYDKIQNGGKTKMEPRKPKTNTKKVNGNAKE